MNFIIYVGQDLNRCRIGPITRRNEMRIAVSVFGRVARADLRAPVQPVVALLAHQLALIADVVRRTVARHRIESADLALRRRRRRCRASRQTVGADAVGFRRPVASAGRSAPVQTRRALLFRQTTLHAAVVGVAVSRIGIEVAVGTKARRRCRS